MPTFWTPIVRSDNSTPAAIDSSAGMVKVSCTTCQREIPLSVAVSSEATDYVAHFCGLDCFDRWRNPPNDIF